MDENKSKNDRLIKDLDRHLPIYHIIFIPVWEPFSRFGIISKDLYTYHCLGAMDGIHRSAFCGRNASDSFIQGGSCKEITYRAEIVY